MLKDSADEEIGKLKTSAAVINNSEGTPRDHELELIPQTRLNYQATEIAEGEIEFSSVGSKSKTAEYEKNMAVLHRDDLSSRPASSRIYTEKKPIIERAAQVVIETCETPRIYLTSDEEEPPQCDGVNENKMF